MPAGTLRLPWLRVFRAFSSVARQMPWYNPQRRGTARTLPKFLWCSMYCLFCVLFMCKCVLYYCHRVATQVELVNISYHHADRLSGPPVTLFGGYWRYLSSRVNRKACQTDHLLPSSTEDKNECICVSASHMPSWCVEGTMHTGKVYGVSALGSETWLQPQHC